MQELRSHVGKVRGDLASYVTWLQTKLLMPEQFVSSANGFLDNGNVVRHLRRVSLTRRGSGGKNSNRMVVNEQNSRARSGLLHDTGGP